MIRFIERLSEKEEGLMEWFSTPTISSARAEQLKAELVALPEILPKPFTLEWATVQNGN
jgi:hypothetical protein